MRAAVCSRSCAITADNHLCHAPHTTLPILRVTRTTSTSALARRYLQQGRTLPFAVLAAQQSAGRGQQQRVWSSPRGNLYLSLAVQPRTRTGLSLLVAALICEWLQTHGIAATCKWPNDILYHGKKLGGVLCEGAIQGKHWRYVIIGIGINVNTVPQQLAAQATSMRAICGQDGDVAEYAQQLVARCAAELARPRRVAEIVARFERFTAAAAELWCRGREFYLRQTHPRGHLQLTALADGKRITMSSSAPEYRLAYQQPHRNSLLVADVGNSSIKLVLFGTDNTHTFSAQATEHSLRAALQKIRTAMAYAGRWVIYTVAVNQAHAALLTRLAEQADFVLAPVEAKPLRVHSDYNLQQLGGDRLAALEAYLAHYAGSAFGIVANFGTATTIDVIAGEHHRGGLILPGLRTSLQALSTHTELPALRENCLAQADATAATTTASAIANGVLFAQSALLQRWQETYRPCRVIISGGLGKYVLPFIKEGQYDPLLVAKGIQLLVLR